MRKTLLIAAAMSAAGLASAQAPVNTVPETFLPGYLAPATVDEPRILPAPPERGLPRAEADRAVFRDTRNLAGTPRYEAALTDASDSVPETFKHFSCALGAEATPDALPKLAHLSGRVWTDIFNANDTGKVYFKRARPPANDPGATCQALTERDMTRDYPSGHASRAWIFALILTELAPDRGNAILTRGRAAGESRVVCGVHNATAIEAGRVVGAAVLSQLHADPSFRADMDAARLEMTEYRRAAPAPDTARCAAETALMEPSPFH